MKKLFLLTLSTVVILLFANDCFASDTVHHHEIAFTRQFAFWAFLLGVLSAISLVLGSMLGIIWQPKPRVTAAFTAFGAGALLAALSVELIAPTVMEFVGQTKLNETGTAGHNAHLEFLSLIGGCMIGGVLFFFLNEILNNSGGYLRKTSTTIGYLNRIQKNRYRLIIKRLSHIKIFRQIPPESVDFFIKHIRHVTFHKGQLIFRAGEVNQRMLVIEQGEISSSSNEKTFGSGTIIGEESLLRHEPMTETITANSDVKAFEITSNDFQLLCSTSPELAKIIANKTRDELLLKIIDNNSNTNEAKDWAEDANEHLHQTGRLPTSNEINESAKKHSSAPLSIWLGIFLDGIPESFVIGAGFMMILATKLAVGTPDFFDVIPYTLIAGLFLSNLPEAMSSSIGMRKMGWKVPKILLLWSSLMLMTALGAVFGFKYGTAVPNYIEIGVEGIAAGAMLTMIAQTMIPEAVHIGGNRVSGLSTLAGYLAAIAFKIFE